MIVLDRVTKQYDNGVRALDRVSLSIAEGEFVYLIGPSGSGKSTLMKLLYREEFHNKGRIIIDQFNLNTMKERQVPELRRTVGVVFQDFKLLPNLTVFENVAYAMEITGASGRAIRKRVKEVLKLVGLTHKSKFYPNEISGGEQQRVVIARAIVNRPKILIADEPTGNLDPDTAIEIHRVLESIHRQGTTIIMGTHNDTIVNYFKHRVVGLYEGRIVRDDHKGEYHESY